MTEPTHVPPLADFLRVVAKSTLNDGLRKNFEQCADEIERLTAELASYEGPRIPELLKENTEFTHQIAVLAAERDRLQDALHRYGEHDEDCAAVNHKKLTVFHHKCTCGYSAALGGTSGAQKELR